MIRGQFGFVQLMGIYGPGQEKQSLHQSMAQPTILDCLSET